MDDHALTAGTLAGAGSFRCERCGYVLTLAASDALSDCPGCGGRSFARASLFSVGQLGRESTETTPEVASADETSWLGAAREGIGQPGEYLLYEEDGEPIVVPLTREWTRVGRSLAADVRFDDPTVSRRHALFVRQPDGVRALDDRSLNGVFVNGERVEWRMLADGDEIVVGRYRLYFARIPARPGDGGGPRRERITGLSAATG
ncbi:MAG TPA: FHA domain-containing protein [Solirubrobacteraceae bacterium]|nr:FHA domain-containing protein [Solirubrobacteraceae bacterium]